MERDKNLTIKIHYGADQEYGIDRLVKDFAANGHIVFMEKGNRWQRDGEEFIPYEIEFKDSYSIYLFGHKSANLIL